MTQTEVKVELPAIDPEQPMFLRVPVKCRQVVIDALVAAGFQQEATAVEQFTSDYVDLEANVERLRWLEMAEAKAARDGEIEFDSDATISHSQEAGEEGQYILGWVWVYDEREHAGVECAHCGEVIEEEEDGDSTPQGSMHKGCADEHERENPEEW